MNEKSTGRNNSGNRVYFAPSDAAWKFTLWMFKYVPKDTMVFGRPACSPSSGLMNSSLLGHVW